MTKPLSSISLTLLAFAALAAASASPASVRAEPKPSAPRKTLRVYHIGNSVTDTIRYPALAQLASSRGQDYVYGRHMIPGAPLEWIWDHPAEGFGDRPYGHYPQALREYKWDVLTLQPFDRKLEGNEDADLPTAKRFIDLALPKSPDVQIYVYSRWPRREEVKGKKGEYVPLDYSAKWLREYTGGWDGTNETRDYFERVVTGLREAYPELKKPVLLIPVGDVMLELDARMRAGKVAGFDNVQQLYRDRIHLNEAGSYVVGCTFYATLFAQSPVGLPSAPYKVTDPKLAQAIQQAAWDVVSKHELAGVAKPAAAAAPKADGE
jgi:hypothetical protein